MIMLSFTQQKTNNLYVNGQFFEICCKLSVGLCNETNLRENSLVQNQNKFYFPFR